MSSRPPGKLIVLPSARLHWEQQRQRRRRSRWMKIIAAGVGLLSLLVALLDVAMETGSVPTPTANGVEEATVEGVDEPPHPAAGRTSREPDNRPALLTSGSD